MKRNSIFPQITAAPMLALALVSAKAQTNALRVGVYDSRAVAVAYGNSTAFRDLNKGINADFEKARASKDEKRMADIKSRMNLKQQHAHEQAFSTGSVIPIMATLSNAMPAVAEAAGVQVILSKWELNYHAPNVQTVDVTDRIVALFDVSGRGKQWSRDIQRKPPIALDDPALHKH
ncbi:MAG TPA: hypothetical protein VEH04_15940 [Verrucomicrobiae bacterium]|nr:hypothetical protein [Verrucomicrobiae bacterium]